MPPVDNAALVSVRLTVSADSTAASLAPLMITVTTCAVPSMVVTVNVSVSVAPALSAWTALLPLSIV